MMVMRHARKNMGNHSVDRSGSTEFEASFADHPIWNARLLRCLSSGWATPEDLHVIEPVLATAVRAHRTCRTAFATRGGAEGGREPGPGQERSDPSSDVPTFALYFVETFGAFCRERAGAEVAAFLAGSELAVNRGVSALKAAQRKAGLTVPIEGTDQNGANAADVPSEHGFGDGGLPAFQAAGEYALSLHLRLLEDLYQALRVQRVSAAFERIQARRSLELPEEPPIPLRPGVGDIMLVERDDGRDIEFSVERYPCTAETLDPRVVRIPPGKTNNLHKHAHETLFCFIDGTGEILVGTTWVPVEPGDAVFAPRWAMHQTRNTGAVDLVLLAITDYYLTSRVYVGKYDKI